MAQTPIYQLPYPVATDPADGPAAYQALAVAAEAMLGPAVSVFPSTPVDGKIIRYKVGANGPVWTLQYLAASTAPYRWHFLGGPELWVEDATSGTTASTVYADLAGTSVGPSLVIPLAGDYFVTVRAQQLNTVANNTQITSYAIGATPAADADAASGVSTTNAGTTDISMRKRKTIAVAGTTLTMRYRYALGPGGAGSSSWSARQLLAAPIRVTG